MALILLWTGDPEEGARVMRPLRAVGTPFADAVRPTPVDSMGSATSPFAQINGWAVGGAVTPHPRRG